MQSKNYIAIILCSSSQYKSSLHIFSKVTGSYLKELDWEKRHFPELISGLSMQFSLGSKRPTVNLRSSRCQPGSNFQICVQNLMWVLITKPDSYPIYTSQLIPFPRSIIIFSGKRLLTPEGVARGFSLARVFFEVCISYRLPQKNHYATVNFFAWVDYFRFQGCFSNLLIILGPTAEFGSICNTRYILPLLIIPPDFSYRCWLEAEKRKLGVGLFS